MPAANVAIEIGNGKSACGKVFTMLWALLIAARGSCGPAGTAGGTFRQRDLYSEPMNPRLRLRYLAAFLLCLATAIAAQTPPEAARAYTAAHRAELVQQFSELLSIPNVAADPANLKRNAELLVRTPRSHLHR